MTDVGSSLQTHRACKASGCGNRAAGADALCGPHHELLARDLGSSLSCVDCGLFVARADGKLRCADCQAVKQASAPTIDQGASRANAGKPPMHLLPYDALAMVAWVLHFGAIKYAARNWEQGGLSWQDCVRAIAAHMGKLLCGQWLDDESGCPHVAHIACNALFLCAMSARKIGLRDLPLSALATTQDQGVWSQTSEQQAACERQLAKKNEPVAPPP